MSVMGRLLAGSAPLRGRANLELIVRPFNYPLTAQFWEVTDPSLAVLLPSVVGGTPAYRRFADEDARGAIAGYVGRKVTDIGHHLNVLEDAGLLRREPDVFRSGRSVYRVAEPLITFYQVVMRPRWGLLESGRGDNVWADGRPRFLAQVVGPHFETICREFAMHAPTTVFGDLPGDVGAGIVGRPHAQITDPGRRCRLRPCSSGGAASGAVAG
jgi:DNA-binding transcriptional ArsR family regulator